MLNHISKRGHWLWYCNELVVIMHLAIIWTDIAQGISLYHIKLMIKKKKKTEGNCCMKLKLKHCICIITIVTSWWHRLNKQEQNNCEESVSWMLHHKLCLVSALFRKEEIIMKKYVVINAAYLWYGQQFGVLWKSSAMDGCISWRDVCSMYWSL